MPGHPEKAGALTHEECVRCKNTRRWGRNSRAVDAYSEIPTVVRLHHERIDGKGYPDGLSHEEIPLVSRIIAVADAYNAMTSDDRTATRCRAELPACASPRQLTASSIRQWSPRSRPY